MFWIKQRLTSFGHAFCGLWVLFRTETHAQIHLLAGVIVLTAGLFTGLQRWEWLGLLLIIALVIALEAVNTALEALSDAVHPESHPLVGKAKDIAAAGVLVCSMAAVAIAMLIFLPHWC